MKFNYSDGIYLEDGEFDNYVQIDGADCKVVALKKCAQSPNGYVFGIEGGDVVPQAIKLCSVHGSPSNIRLQHKKQRFEREIEALHKVKASGSTQHVIEIYYDDILEIEYDKNGNTLDFRFFTMEKGEYDLSAFLRQNVSLSQRFLLCAQMIRSVKALHDIDIYHRDIKPANFIFINEVWKVADLGLIDSRNEDFESIDWSNERIGPRGFLSPEAINKWLSKSLVSIDDKSDVFQLAKVIGFVLLEEVLTGHIQANDLNSVDTSGALFSVMDKAFQYLKERRSNIDEFEDEFLAKFGKQYALI